VVPSANAATQGPTTNKRAIKTNVLVENGQILVLGGLIDDKLDESAQKVPLLGDMPVLGNLFRYRNTTKLKRNLMVFLHPVILRDANTGQSVYRAVSTAISVRSNWQPAIKVFTCCPTCNPRC
jgi:general secretion pathway protein D